MTEEISKTRSGKEFKGDNGQEDLEEFYPKGKDEDDPDELQKPRSDESQTTDIIKLMQFMVLQEQKREQERREEKERREQERREEKERYEQERREEKERYEQEKRRYEQEKREERERYERDRRLEMERQERLEKERERERQEMKKQLDQVQRQRKEELHQLESMMKLREVNMTKLNPTDDIENYLTTFERTAKTFDWPKEKWVVKLVPYLTGKAQAAYAAMSITESNDYDKVKEAILKRYDITEETYRQRFRSTKKFRDESYKEMYVRLKDLFRKWTKPDGKTVDEITETVIMEQLVDTMPPGVQIWVREHRPSTGVAAAELADDYFDARKGIQNEPPKRPHTTQERLPTSPKDNEKEGTPANQAEKVNSPQPWRSNDKPKIRCRNCNKEGHIEKFCRKRTSYLSRRSNKCPYTDFVIPGRIDGQNVEMVLDSGCDMTLVHWDLVDPKKINHQERTHIRCIHDHHSDYPTANVLIEINGEPSEVVVGVSKDLPRHALLGKDFPQFYDLLSKVRPEVEDGLVVTRAQARRDKRQREEETKEEKRCKVQPRNLDDIVLPDISKEFGQMDIGSFMDGPNKVKTKKSRNQKRQQRKQYSQMKTESLDKSESPDVDPKTIKDLQMADSTLNSLRIQAAKQSKDDEIQIIYKEGIMYRQVSSKELPEPIEQLILPRQCRQNVLKIAHDIPLAGHMGIKKTLARIRQRFFWPNMTKDVKTYCKSCEACQKTSKHGTKFRAPMQSMPVIDEPFTRIAMDIVGPLDRSKAGNKYILVICDYATRYPEAIPLRSIEAKKIADELIKLFSKVGIPQEILTDQGSNFTSKLLKEIYRLLQIKGITTAPYHPQTDGMVERLNGTLKAMIRKFVASDPLNWDQLIPYLLFAYREVPQESTGFSPFELLYGRKVRGPLDVMKETWTGTVSGPKSVVTHIVTMRERLSSMTDLMRENMKEAQQRQKKWYDTKSRVREFTPGQEVLLLLPSSSNALQAKWQGPFKVVRRVGPVDYEIETNHKGRKLKVYHVNLLKEFKRRSMDSFMLITDVIGDEEGEDTDVTWSDEEDHEQDLNINKDITEAQRVQLTMLVDNFKTVFSNRPGKTTVIEHNIEMKEDETPVRQRPYPIPQAKIGKVKEEVQSMIDLGVIEESNSPWSSPYVMVPKADGTTRFCVNFKKVNGLSKFDAYPMPRIEEILARLGPSKYITKLDLCKGYWQVPLTEHSKQYTAFSTPTGLYQFKYLPFGLHGAPATFQRMMDRLLKGKEEYAAAYMDDLVIFSTEFDVHLDHLKDILETLQEANLTVKPSKCSFAQSQVNYLGYLVGNGHLEPQQTKVEAVLKWEQPKTKKDVKSFLGLTGYYRKFVPNYADIAAPLTDLTTKKKPEKVSWTPECEKAFEDLKAILCSHPVLRNPDFDKEFVLQTDASERGLGAVLSQYDDEGKDHPVLYLSRKLLPREQNYATIEKECLAIKWAICSLQYYLLGREFKIVTDHQPLRWLNEMKDNNKRLTRWSLDLQPYCYEVIHRKGLSNGNADGLSRTTGQ